MRCLSKPFFFCLLLLIPFAALAQTGSSDTTVILEGATNDISLDSTLATEPPPAYSTDTDTGPRQLNTASPTPQDWKRLESGKEFGYKDAREYIAAKNPPKPPEVPGWLKALAKFFSFFTTTAGHVILFSLLALIVGYIIYIFIVGNAGIFSRNKKVGPKTAESPELSEEDLVASDWEGKLRAAMANGDHRLAIRYSYLLLLQLLQRRDLIKYRQDKTNTDYYRELATTAERLRPDFRSITRQYEWAWYGAFVGAQSEFDAYFSNFNRLKAAIG